MKKAIRKEHIKFSLILLFLLKLAVFSQSWKLVWSDEFDGPAIDTNKWGYDIGTGNGGWGNNELQYYTNRPENSYIQNGNLVIEARKENYGGSQYTSARMVTRFKGDWKYGRIEVRAKLPFGQGIWPAIWMLPTDWVYGGWPASGEIDIMEMLGHDVYTIYGSLHFGGNNQEHVYTSTAYQLPAGDFVNNYHVFALEWEEEEFRWYVDGHLYKITNNWYTTQAPYPAPFDQRFHLILNIAVGGTWPGNPDATTQFPQKMFVDYVRVYKDTSTKPFVQITDPQDGSTFQVGDSIVIQASVSGITNPDYVEFYNGDVAIGKAVQYPYQLVLHNVQSGRYNLRARIIKDNSSLDLSTPIFISVGMPSQQSPVSIQPHRIPGIIEFENYDMGGEGIAYHDVDSRNQGTTLGTFFRASEGVDVQKTDDNTGGYNVGWIQPGEWLEYMVYVENNGIYEASYRVSSPSQGAFHLEFNGENRTGYIAVPFTNGWQNWTSVRRNVTLDKGLQVMRFVVDQGEFNINNVTFTLKTLNIEGKNKVPGSMKLYQNYPNPFNPTTTITYYLPVASEIKLVLYNVSGQRIRILDAGLKASGLHTVILNAHDLPNGLYFYKLITENEMIVKKMLVLK
jgi:beta-glucanase (GH16 family)